MPEGEPEGSDLLLDLVRIAADARARRAGDDAYRAWLKERSPLSNDALDAVVAGIRADVEPRVDCVACNHCCRTLSIVLDRKDVARLARRLGTTVDAFVREHVGVAEDGTAHFKGRPCPMLGADGACTVYEDRPRACRDYPYLDTPRVRSRSVTVRENVERCPIVFNVWRRLRAAHPMPGGD